MAKGVGDPVAVAQEHIIKALAEWRQGTPPTDDVSIVTIERRN